MVAGCPRPAVKSLSSKAGTMASPLHNYQDTKLFISHTINIATGSLKPLILTTIYKEGWSCRQKRHFHKAAIQR